MTVGFAVSNQVAAAISKGAGRPRDVMANAASLAKVWLGLGAALYLFLAIAAPLLTGLFHVDAEQQDTFVSFLRWTSVANLLAIGAELCASSLRGYGCVRHATLLVVCTASVRIGLVAGLGLGTDIGVAAVPIAEATAGLPPINHQRSGARVVRPAATVTPASASIMMPVRHQYLCRSAELKPIHTSGMSRMLSPHTRTTTALT
ncbi:hypothetical protein OG819_51095 [Streptomyces sp. NBC_01549]|uniref:hypothetical protein n=1 Tax=unclassified Streptomyces TaxID=2593676 RepID=UPI002259BA4B|nr:hypothetical protein [Streptomyces sp. NBC_01549]MCX4597615.1 hypothetical protein [Streptomyces sp. NBC_01549]